MIPVEQFLSDLYRQGVSLSAEGDNLRCSAPEDVFTDALREQLQTRKAEILAFLNQAAQQTGIATTAIPAVPRNGDLLLSFAQQRLWFLDQMQQEGAVYNIPMAVEVQGVLDVKALCQSLQDILARHESLRTSFKTVDGQPVQVIAEPYDMGLAQWDLQEYSTSEQQELIQERLLLEAQTPFDLAQDQLWRVMLLKLNTTTSVILLTMHHIISDGWSMEVLLQELAALYRGYVTDAPITLPALPIQYADFAAWQRQWLQGDVLDNQLDYWRGQLGDNLPVLQLSTDFPRARVQTISGEVASFSLSAELTEQLRTLGQRHTATLFMTLLAAFNVLLYRYSGQTDIVVGSPIANRNRPEVEGLIGFFVNTLVLRSTFSPLDRFDELLEHVKNHTWQAYEHQDLPFEKLVEDLQPERDLSYHPLFQVKFRLESASRQTVTFPGLTLKLLPQAYTTAKLDLGVDLYETPDGLVGGFEYNSDLFHADTIHRMVRHFETLLKAIAADPTQRIAALPLLTAEERQTMVQGWNDTQTPYDTERCFHHLFEAQVSANPNAIALIFDGPDVQTLTYDELNRQSNQLAHYLQAHGVGPEVKVGIRIDRSPQQIIAMLAILKAGGAYLPLDPAYPAERLAFMLEDAQVPVLLTHAEVDPLETRDQARRIDLDREWATIARYPDSNPNSGVTPDHLAYLIYTSGSTGLPKGVLLPHGGLVNLTEDKIRVCQVAAGDCVLQFFSFSFDGCIPEIIMALATGAKLLLAPNATLLPGPGLGRLLRRHGVTHITVTPSALLSVPVEDFPDLRMVLVGGEAPSPELIANWCPGRRFINGYGPTETTVNASMVLCGNEHPIEPTLRPSANKQLYVLDEQLQLTPIGVAGELHIGGVGLARGYLNRPELTAEQFIPNPYGPATSPVLYKTGDLANYLPDGRIKILGRLDTQVKLRGFRVEPGEVERQLAAHPDVKTSVVIVREDTPGAKRLVAYGVPQELDSEARPTPHTLRRFLAEKLPHYMVPAAFVWLDALPLNPNGKIDIPALPQPQEVSTSPEGMAPRTATETALAEVFSDVLELDSVSIDSNFFDLGGHSLLATRLIAKLMTLFNLELTVLDLFEASTVAELAERIEQKRLLEDLGSTEVEGDREEIAL